MSTRSITHVYGGYDWNRDDIVCSFYRHHDGYPSEHGADVAEFLAGKKIINGYGNDYVEGRDFNGTGRLAVHLMTHINEISGCDSLPAGKSDMWEEYTYFVRWDAEAGRMLVEVHSGESTVSAFADEWDADKIKRALNPDYYDDEQEDETDPLPPLTPAQTEQLAAVREAAKSEESRSTFSDAYKGLSATLKLMALMFTLQDEPDRAADVNAVLAHFQADPTGDAS